jgi:hypothetical protein
MILLEKSGLCAHFHAGTVFLVLRHQSGIRGIGIPQRHLFGPLSTSTFTSNVLVFGPLVPSAASQFDGLLESEPSWCDLFTELAKPPNLESPHCPSSPRTDTKMGRIRSTHPRSSDIPVSAGLLQQRGHGSDVVRRLSCNRRELKGTMKNLIIFTLLPHRGHQ